MTYDSVFRPGLFAGRTIIVTGGGSGLGRCTAHELKSLGARLALIGRSTDKLARVKEELGRAWLERHPWQELLLASGWRPGPKFLEKYGIEQGKAMPATVCASIGSAFSGAGVGIIRSSAIDRLWARSASSWNNRGLSSE